MHPKSKSIVETAFIDKRLVLHLALLCIASYRDTTENERQPYDSIYNILLHFNFINFKTEPRHKYCVKVKKHPASAKLPPFIFQRISSKQKKNGSRPSSY
ncbi:hypothetical protein EVA_11340 [gut metagenome]|uniref:Uncharacterized protein n=1 Tax=gut metagenome TaxID=749906 RepID=J9G016_9ZZZZ